MSYWGDLNNASGNQKPIWANTSDVYGVSTTESQNTTVLRTVGVAHSGWVKATKGTGAIASIQITNPGAGINANGFLVISSSDVGGANANVRYIATSNTVNALNNVVSTLVIVNAGEYATTPTVTYVGANTVRPTFSVTMGGRAGRITTEVLVATGSMRADDTGDNTIFPGT